MTAPQSVSLAQLLAGSLSSANITKFLALLTLAGFPATSWQSGSVPSTIVNSEASILQDLGNAIALVAKNGYLPSADDPNTGASGAWLDLLGNSFFQEPRSPATITQGWIVLTDTANAGPFTITPNQIWAADGSQTYKFNSTNAANITLPLGGSVAVPVQAEFVGAAYNIANGGITVLLTSLPGVTVTNPAVTGTSTWITLVGNDAESDMAYAGRLASKWSLLGTGSNDGAYLYNTLTPSVTGTTEPTRAVVFLGDDVGSVDVVVAGANGPISSSAHSLVDAVLQAKRPTTVEVNLLDAVATQTAIVGTLYVSSNYDPTATLAAVQNALGSLSTAFPLGNTLYLDQIITTICNVPGVRNVVLSSPVSDTPTDVGQVLTMVYSMTASH